MLFSARLLWWVVCRLLFRTRWKDAISSNTLSVFVFFLIARLCGYSHTNIWCFNVVCKISEGVFLHHVRRCLCCGGTQQRMTVYWWLNLLIHNKENRFYSAWSPWGYQNRHKGCASETSVCKIIDNLLRKRRKT